MLCLNGQAQTMLRASSKGRNRSPSHATRFEEPGTLEQVSRLAADRFERHLDRSEDPEIRHLDRVVVFSSRRSTPRSRD
jgi:hypothetical protein